MNGTSKPVLPEFLTKYGINIQPFLFSLLDIVLKSEKSQFRDFTHDFASRIEIFLNGEFSKKGA